MISKRQRAYSYFPGCSLETTNKAYDISTRNVARVLGLEMVELEDWNCCGATAYLATDPRRAHVLSARNLALAEETSEHLICICSGCYLVLHKANKLFQESEKDRREIRRALQAGNMDYHGRVQVRHFLDVVVGDLGREAISRHVVKSLKGLRVACYYGCQITRPYGEIDDPEFPSSMGDLMRWLGATPVDFRLGARCCGGMTMTTHPELGRKLTGKLLLAARQAGADCIATACPLCQMNLEAYQDRIGDDMLQECHIPVVYFTQLLGASLGLGGEEIAEADSLTPVREVFASKGVTL